MKKAIIGMDSAGGTSRSTITRAWVGGRTAQVLVDFVEVETPAPAPPVAQARVLVVEPRRPEPEPIDYCLIRWRDWMRTGGHRDLGARVMSDGVGGSCVDVYEQQHQRDMDVAKATDAMIDSMAALYRWAIYKSCSIAYPWRFPNADPLVVIEPAREALESLLRKNSCTAVLF